jgi:hypothetical protein
MREIWQRNQSAPEAKQVRRLTVTLPPIVIPAKAGTQAGLPPRFREGGLCAGMTAWVAVRASQDIRQQQGTFVRQRIACSLMSKFVVACVAYGT